MAEKLMEKSCIEFADALAAKVSVPGGGGAAAYVGALGVALGSMTANFTTGKKKYAEYEEDIQRILAEGDVIRAKLIDLVFADAEAFEPLSKAYGIPKEDPTRDQVLEEATVKGSKMLISDVACGAVMSAAAMRAAALNVFINTKSLQDRDLAAKLEAEADELLAFVPRAKVVADEITDYIRG